MAHNTTNSNYLDCLAWNTSLGIQSNEQIPNSTSTLNNISTEWITYPYIQYKILLNEYQ